MASKQSPTFRFQAWHISKDFDVESLEENRQMASFVENHVSRQLKGLISIGPVVPTRAYPTLAVARSIRIRLKRPTMDWEGNMRQLSKVELPAIIKRYFKVKLNKTLDFYNAFAEELAPDQIPEYGKVLVSADLQRKVRDVLSRVREEAWGDLAVGIQDGKFNAARFISERSRAPRKRLRGDYYSPRSLTPSTASIRSESPADSIFGIKPNAKLRIATKNLAELHRRRSSSVSSASSVCSLSPVDLEKSKSTVSAMCGTSTFDDESEADVSMSCETPTTSNDGKSTFSFVYDTPSNQSQGQPSSKVSVTCGTTRSKNRVRRTSSVSFVSSPLSTEKSIETEETLSLTFDSSTNETRVHRSSSSISFVPSQVKVEEEIEPEDALQLVLHAPLSRKLTKKTSTVSIVHESIASHEAQAQPTITFEEKEETLLDIDQEIHSPPEFIDESPLDKSEDVSPILRFVDELLSESEPDFEPHSPATPETVKEIKKIDGGESSTFTSIVPGKGVDAEKERIVEQIVELDTPTSISPETPVEKELERGHRLKGDLDVANTEKSVPEPTWDDEEGEITLVEDPELMASTPVKAVPTEKAKPRRSVTFDLQPNVIGDSAIIDEADVVEEPEMVEEPKLKPTPSFACEPVVEPSEEEPESLVYEIPQNLVEEEIIETILPPEVEEEAPDLPEVFAAGSCLAYIMLPQTNLAMIFFQRPDDMIQFGLLSKSDIGRHDVSLCIGSTITRAAANSPLQALKKDGTIALYFQRPIDFAHQRPIIAECKMVQDGDMITWEVRNIDLKMSATLQPRSDIGYKRVLFLESESRPGEVVAASCSQDNKWRVAHTPITMPISTGSFSFTTAGIAGVGGNVSDFFRIRSLNEREVVQCEIEGLRSWPGLGDQEISEAKIQVARKPLNWHGKTPCAFPLSCALVEGNKAALIGVLCRTDDNGLQLYRGHPWWDEFKKPELICKVKDGSNFLYIKDWGDILYLTPDGDMSRAHVTLHRNNSVTVNIHSALKINDAMSMALGEDFFA
ncbi:unnamed protein product [Clonostachys chloroleuca]|uniref:Uncharacterized protein n=1 Tax=Clonostachys chloroleuca TaxID=1926264 RepID=A0AA35MGE1_9HYPO|nr:unnamed protein product [Clonostachys chloroleuca]